MVLERVGGTIRLQCGGENAAERRPLVLLLFLLFLFQDPLSLMVGSLSFFDEILAILFLGIMAMDMVTRRGVVRMPKWLFAVTAAGGVIAFLGICGNVAWGYQKVLYAAFDVLAFLKFFVGLYVGSLCWKLKENHWLKTRVVFICKLLAVVQFVLCIHEEFFAPWFPYMRGYADLHTLMLFYSNPTYFVAYSIFVLAILFFWNAEDTHNVWFVGMLMVEIGLSMRGKAFGFLAVLFLLILITKKIRLRNPLMFAAVGIPVMLYAAWDKIELYFFNESHYSPRAVILRDGFGLASRHFPLGTGFGTFCSPGANLGGSILYTELGNDYSSEYIATAINDMYWGYLMAQFGWIGAVLMVGALVLLCLKGWKLQKEDRPAFLCVMSLLIYPLIASVGESPFFAAYIMGYAFVVGMVMTEGENGINEENFTA